MIKNKLLIFNTENLSFDNPNVLYVRWKVCMIIVLLSIVVSGYVGYLNSKTITNNKVVHTYTSSTDTIFENNEFSKEKFVEVLYKVNVKYPHIVMAQAIIESGNFTSSIFKQNNNMFGMRLPRQRATIAIGEQNGFAIYNSWKDCIYDYALYQYSVMSTCNSEEEYFNRLEERYAQDTTYVSVLKSTIKNQNLKALFYE